MEYVPSLRLALATVSPVCFDGPLPKTMEYVPSLRLALATVSPVCFDDPLPKTMEYVPSLRLALATVSLVCFDAPLPKTMEYVPSLRLALATVSPVSFDSLLSKTMEYVPSRRLPSKFNCGYGEGGTKGSVSSSSTSDVRGLTEKSAGGPRFSAPITSGRCAQEWEPQARSSPRSSESSFEVFFFLPERTFGLWTGPR